MVRGFAVQAASDGVIPRGVTKEMSRLKTSKPRVRIITDTKRQHGCPTAVFLRGWLATFFPMAHREVGPRWRPNPKT
jgi:hypothetical protein